jgi:hypothetical protein
MAEDISKIREKPGESNAGKYSGVKKSNFAGPDKTFPINTPKRAHAALSYAHNAANPEGIKEKVYAKYPALKKRHEERTGMDRKKYDAYKNK